MKNYVGSKIIKAEPMTEINFLWGFKRGVGAEKDTEDRPGYHVEYPDGYHSWSPKDTFETAYRLITDSELDLIMGRPETEQGGANDGQ